MSRKYDDAHRVVGGIQGPIITRSDYSDEWVIRVLVSTKRRAMQVADTLADNQRLRALVKQAEWDATTAKGNHPCCPWCWTPRNHSHKKSCPAFDAEGNVR